MGRGKIAIVDHSMKIIAKCSIEGNVVEVIGDYLLTDSGNIGGYLYTLYATVRIYHLYKKIKPLHSRKASE